MGILSRIKRRLPILGGRGQEAGPEAKGAISPQRRPVPMYTPPPEPKPARGEQPVRAYIEEVVRSHEIVIFMKGSPEAPMCGFSATAASILLGYGRPVHSVDVIADPEAREDVKAFTNWPTIPQVFVRGQFVGGADILQQMHQSGELRTTIEGTAG